MPNSMKENPKIISCVVFVKLFLNKFTNVTLGIVVHIERKIPLIIQNFESIEILALCLFCKKSFIKYINAYKTIIKLTKA